MNVKRRIKRGLNRLYRKHNFVVLHTGRCGSTVVGSLLMQHPEIGYLGEFFFERCRKPKPFEELAKAMGRYRCRFLGFDAKIQQTAHFNAMGIDLHTFVTRLQRMGYTHFVVLKRENILRQIISVRRGQDIRRWHSTGDVQKFKVRIDINSVFNNGRPLAKSLEYLEQVYRDLFMIMNTNKVLTLNYERDVERDPRVAYRAVCEFLGAPPAPALIPLQRTNPFPTRDVIENLDEVEGALRGTRYEWMLAEDPPEGSAAPGAPVPVARDGGVVTRSEEPAGI